MSICMMLNDEMILQDDQSKLHKIRRVQDTIFCENENKKYTHWFWIYIETSEFFYIDLWSSLEHAQLNQTIQYKTTRFKVLAIRFNTY